MDEEEDSCMSDVDNDNKDKINWKVIKFVFLFFYYYSYFKEDLCFIEGLFFNKAE